MGIALVAHYSICVRRLRAFWVPQMSDVVLVNMHEAKSQRSQLAKRIWQGERVVITKAGKPYLDLMPHMEKPNRRVPDRLKGRVRIKTGFEETPQEFIDDFERSAL